MPIVGGTGIGTTGLVWSGGIGRDPKSGQIMALDPSFDTSVFDAGGWKSKLAQEVQGFIGGQYKPQLSPGGLYKGVKAQGPGVGATDFSGGGGAGGFSGAGVSTSGPGGYNIAAQIAALNKQYADSQKLQSGAAMEQQAIRNNFSSDFGAQEVNRLKAGSEAERLAAIERLMNQKAGFDWQQQMAQWDRANSMSNQGMGGEAQRFGSANESQQMQELLKALGGMGGVGGGGGMNKPGGGMGAPAGGSATKPSGEPIRGPGEDFNTFNARWQKWFRDKTAKPPSATGPFPPHDTTGSGISWRRDPVTGKVSAWSGKDEEDTIWNR